jgi:hypothetical protein
MDEELELTENNDEDEQEEHDLRVITDIEQALDEQVKLENAVANRHRYEASIKNIWGHSGTGMEAKRAAMSMLSTKIGLYSRIPIICKAACCPYVDTCSLAKYDLAPEGEACPAEAASIEIRYAAYDEQFNLDESSFTDVNLVSELINLDVMADRCKALISKEQVPVVDIVAGINDRGEEYTQPMVSKYWEAYEKTLKRRQEILQLMMATRKDHKEKDKKEADVFELLRGIENNGGFVEDQKPKHIIDLEPAR